MTTSPYSLRIIFTYVRMTVAPISCQKIRMLAPPDEVVRPVKGQTGFWVELLDKNAQILYSQIRHNPINYYHEEPLDNGSYRVHKINDPKGMFQVLIPFLDEAQSLVLLSSPPDEPYKSAIEISNLSLEYLLKLNADV